MTQRPLVYLYDRSAALHSRRLLHLRLIGCRTTAARHGWDVAGVWTDRGADALSDLLSERPPSCTSCAR
ncbi:hypothetical protein [Streptomyces sp. NPDC059080]|uniref:hypothetical protein n=1 Tax=Streptomyces sp. NPDC059080 TaxID=3346718 RepID=UPI00368F278F